MKKIAFIIRGTLKHPGRFRANVSKIFNNDFDATIKFTRTKGHAIDIVQDLLAKGTDYVVAVGGDGTLNEVINGYMLAPLEHREHVVVAVYPRGAGNDFTRTAGRMESLEHLFNAIKNHQIKPIDIIKAHYTENGVQKIRYYDNSFDIGLGGLVCEQVNRSNKTWGSNFTYLYNIIRSFLRFKRISITLISPDFTFEGRVLELAINNGKYYGSGLCITPDAKLDDGLANVIIARDVNLLQFLKHIPAIKKGHRLKLDEVFYYTLKECIIESPLKNVPMEFDGEVLGTLPLNLKVMPKALNLLIP